MPQFDPTYFVSQVFWLVVVFAILFIILWKMILPRISSVMESREEKVAADLKRAEDAKQDAEKILAAYEASLAAAHADAQVLTDKATASIAKDQAKRMATFEADVAARLEEAEARIAKASEDAMEHVRDMAGEVATAAVEKLSGSKANARSITAAVNAAMK
jgi:F-type H+-transporting ATPase subunit b